MAGVVKVSFRTEAEFLRFVQYVKAPYEQGIQVRDVHMVYYTNYHLHANGARLRLQRFKNAMELFLVQEGSEKCVAMRRCAISFLDFEANCEEIVGQEVLEGLGGPVHRLAELTVHQELFHNQNSLIRFVCSAYTVLAPTRLPHYEVCGYGSSPTLIQKHFEVVALQQNIHLHYGCSDIVDEVLAAD